MKDDQQALFICVDENDKIIGYQTRYECHHNRDIIHRGVDVVLFNNKKDKILLQKRSMRKDTYPGFYTVSASGHVDKGESYKQAAYREMQEELGIYNCEKIKLKEAGKYIIRLSDESEMTVLFTGTYEGELQPAIDEVESVVYVGTKELITIKESLTPGGKATLYKLGLL